MSQTSKNDSKSDDVALNAEKGVSDSSAQRLYEIYKDVIQRSESISSKHPVLTKQNEMSRDNLLTYLALREHDISELQLTLADEGLSSLGRLEGQVLVSMEEVLRWLGIEPKETTLAKPTFKKTSALLEERSKQLLGRPREGRRTRIMVTLDPATMYQPELLEQLLLSGMDIARINCAHDSQREWLMLITAIRTAEERLIQRGKGIGRSCRILMDLAGPKIRTGPLSLEVRPLKLSVPKDPEGKPSKMLEGMLDCEAAQTEKLSLTGMMSSFSVALTEPTSLAGLFVGERLQFTDARGRNRAFVVLEKLTPTKVRVGLARTAYLEEGIEISSESGTKLVVGPVKPQPGEIAVKSGDKIRLYRNSNRLGKASINSEPAEIGCTLPEALQNVGIGHRTFIDDGKIAAKVLSVNENYLELEVVSPVETSASIKSEKGLNFPDSIINLSALTAEDIKNLEFVAEHATAVGLSFVHKSEDLYYLRDALKKLKHEKIGIIAKIETKESVHNLAEILLAGLNLPNFGVLIARGDLAVEVGFENLAFVQEDILCMCEAAHTPVVFATQVLETLAKSGLPSRAEITDAAMGIRAESVMLNKGPHILEATRTLAGLLTIEERRQLKKRQIFREFTKQNGIYDNHSNLTPSPAVTAK